MADRLLLADDNPLFCDGMASLLSQRDDIVVVGVARTAVEAVRKATVLRPDVILMELALPLGGGIEATRQILRERPGQPVCILTSSEREDDLFEAIRAGARGYLVKNVAPERLCAAVHALAAGGSVISPPLAARLLVEFVRLSPGFLGTADTIDRLSGRERQVLELVVTGASNREIAQQLEISENTVKVHLCNMLDKLRLRNRQHVAAYAVQHGWLRELHAPGRAVLH